MVESMKRYTVRFERDEGGWWVGTVLHSVAAIHEGEPSTRPDVGFGNLWLFIDNANSVQLRERIELPQDVQNTDR